MEKTMEKIVALAKARGFVYPGSEIYGGLANTWDYGNLGVELKNNVKKAWWQKFVQESPYNVGVDCAILMNPQTWVASGHLGGFSDPLMDCRECHERFRADKLIEDWCAETGFELPKAVDAFSQQEMKDFIEEHNIPCPTCGKHNFTDIRQFNLMFKTTIGATSDENDPNATGWLRPETAQSIFCQYKNILDSSRVKLPFGIAQIGKSFRNEINPRNFTFRSREFEQMEIEYFCRPEDGLRLVDEWLEHRLCFYDEVGVPREHIHILDVPDGERAFYSKKTYDLEYEFPFGIQELEGIAYRTDYDLSCHQKGSGRPLEYFDEETREKFIPHVVEPSAGCDRTILAIICEAYDEEELVDDKGKKDVRTVLRFVPRMAPIKAAIFPLLKKNGEQVRIAREIEKTLQPWMSVFYDETGAVGRRYRRQDEVGTPFCITVDFETLGENDASLKGTVTIRHRDSMKQERVAIEDLLHWLIARIR